ncbi:MAG: ABC transporter ATP-binding protein/permease [Flavobacteriia bacterium]|nr:ABC transporter ATP-binding protein/permease [Flavobacteriia bacterium]
MKELKHLNTYFYHYRYKLLIGVFITIIARVFSLVMPPFINKSVQAVEVFLTGPVADASLVKAQLLEYVLIIIGAALLSGFFTFLMRQTIINVSRYIERDLKNEVFDHYQKLHLGFYKNHRTGDLMNRISEDVSQVRMYAGPAIMYGIQTLTLFCCLIPLMFMKAPTLAAYTLLPLPFLSVLIYKISKIIHKRSTAVQTFLSSLSTFTQEQFSGISVIKAYHLEGQTNKNLTMLANEGRQKSISLAKVNAWFFPLMILMIGVSNLLVIYIGGKQYISGEIRSIGLILEFIIYVNMLTWPVAIVGWLTSIIQQAEASQKRINEFLQTKTAIEDNPKAPHEIKGNIVFDQVSFRYPETGILAIDSLSFEVKIGETLAIIGKTGSGKSTVLELLTRMYDIDQGSVSLDGKDIKKLSLSSLRSSMGMVPQDAFLFSDSIYNNIAFGKEGATKEEVISAAKKAKVHKNITSFSKAYETVLGERGITLSGGQKQRVSIARALIKDPSIYLFDDCLSAVDTETEEAILKTLKQSAKGKSCLIVSHRVSAAKNADKIIVLEDGKKIQEGTHQELVQTNGYYKALYDSQSAQKEK